MKRVLQWEMVLGSLFLLVACQKTSNPTANPEAVFAKDLRTGEVQQFDSRADVPTTFVVCVEQDCVSVVPEPPSTAVSCANSLIALTPCSGGLVPVRDDQGCVIRYECVAHCKEGKCPSADQVCDATCPNDVPGLCVLKPAACPDLFRPVCGCDGKTYPNDCTRLGAGAAFHHDGECTAKCGPFPGGQCAADEVCDVQSCLLGGSGECKKRPQVCSAIWAPVCGCDGKTYDNDCTRLGAGAARKSAGECPAIGSKLGWFDTCGDPVCRVDPDPTPSALPKCTADQQVGKPCTKEGELCDFGGGCGVKRVCAAKNPTLSGCPISTRSAKTDIRYLSGDSLQSVARDVDRIKLAQYRYRADPQGKTHLGFIIEDMPESQAVAQSKTMVDLYGYTSMVVAALQVQKKMIEEQQREIKALRDELTSLQKQPRR